MTATKTKVKLTESQRSAAGNAKQAWTGVDLEANPDLTPRDRCKETGNHDYYDYGRSKVRVVYVKKPEDIKSEASSWRWATSRVVVNYQVALVDGEVWLHHGGYSGGCVYGRHGADEHGWTSKDAQLIKPRAIAVAEALQEYVDTLGLHPPTNKQLDLEELNTKIRGLLKVSGYAGLLINMPKRNQYIPEDIRADACDIRDKVQGILDLLRSRKIGLENEIDSEEGGTC